MRNTECWRPSKYVMERGRLVASSDTKQLGAASRLVASTVASHYDRNLRQHARGNLLDLGCGKAPLYVLYKNYVTDITCVDWNQSIHDNDHIDHECNLTERLPFGNGEFDTVLMSDVLEHIPVPEQLWGEIARVLAPGGKVVMNVPFLYWIHEEPYDYYRYTEFALRRFVDTAGLDLLDIKATGGVPEVLTDMIAKGMCKVPWIGQALAVSVQWITCQFVKTRIGRRISQASSRKFPFGYFVIAMKPIQ